MFKRGDKVVTKFDATAKIFLPKGTPGKVLGWGMEIAHRKGRAYPKAIEVEVEFAKVSAFPVPIKVLKKAKK